MSCFVPECKTGYNCLRKLNKKLGIRNPSMFRAPSAAEQLELWSAAIRRGDKMLTPLDSVCEIHFKEEDIERVYTTNMPDGTKHVIPRGKPKLVYGAVPSIFPHFPKYANTETKKRKPPVARDQPSKKSKIQESSEHSREEVSEICDPAPPAIAPAVFCDADLKRFTLPSHFWLCGIVNGRIGITHWAEDLQSITQRIVIENDYKMKVYVSSDEVSEDIFGEDYMLNSLEDLTNILKVIDKIVMCQGAADGRKSMNGMKVVQSNVDKMEKHTPRCSRCKKILGSKISRDEHKDIFIEEFGKFMKRRLRKD